MLVLALLCATPVLSLEIPADADAYMDAVLSQDPLKEDLRMKIPLAGDFNLTQDGREITGVFMQNLDGLRNLGCSQEAGCYSGDTKIFCRIGVGPLTVLAFTDSTEDTHNGKTMLKSDGEIYCGFEFLGKPRKKPTRINLHFIDVDFVTIYHKHIGHERLRAIEKLILADIKPKVSTEALWVLDLPLKQAARRIPLPVARAQPQE